MHRPDQLIRLAALACLAAFVAPRLHAANWQVSRVNHATLALPEGVTAAEMSGVSYLGPVGAYHRFIAAEETKGELIQFDLAIDPTGAITGTTNVSSISMSPLEDLEDYEGIAYTNPTRDSVFLSDEDALGAGDRVGIREVSLATGVELQSVAIPAVFANRRANFGFESLTRATTGNAMWTANEEALTVDGPLATATVGSTVRLLELPVAGNAVSAGRQFAYVTQPIHGFAISQSRSGLSDLVAMPDGTLLALERSLALTSPAYLNRIFEIDYSAATDVSLPPFASGLASTTYAPVAKELLWSGAADGGAGQNLEGLSLGPQLPNGLWVLIGVVDDGDEFSGNTVVAFTATAIPSADFDADGDTDGADFLQWQRSVGQTIGASFQNGDATRDGAIDNEDLEAWRQEFPATASTASAIPEPASAASFVIALTALILTSRRR